MITWDSSLLLVEKSELESEAEYFAGQWGAPLTKLQCRLPGKSAAAEYELCFKIVNKP